MTRFVSTRLARVGASGAARTALALTLAAAGGAGVASAPWERVSSGGEAAQRAGADVAPQARRDAGAPNEAGGARLDDPAVLDGRLENGLRVIVWATDASPGRAALWLVVRAGSLDEGEAERGAALLTHRLAFRSTEHFQGSEAEETFQRLGMEFDPLRSGWVSLDHTTYVLDAPVGAEQGLEQAILFLSDALGRVRFDAEAVEREKAVLVEELRARLGWQQRLRDAVLPALLPERGDRSPIPTPETVEGLDVADAARWYERVYGPERATLIVSGDVDPSRIEAMVRERFAPLPGDRPRAPAMAERRLRTMERLTPVAIGDPEIVAPVIELGRTSRADGPLRDEDDLRRWIRNRVCERALDERLTRLVDAGDARFSGVATYSDRLFDGLHYAALNVTSATPDWREPLGALAREIERVRRHAFSEREIEAASRLVALDLRASLEPGDRSPLHRRRSPLLGAALTEGAALSPLWLAERVEETGAGLTMGEVKEWVRRRLDPTRSLALVAAPGEAPDPSRIESTVREAVEAPLEALLEAPVDAPLLSERPGPGAVESIEAHAPSKAISVWLSNGVRVHHRRMHTPAEEVRISISLAGGRIEEDAWSRGLTSAATAALERPSTERLDGSEVRSALRAAGMTLEAWATLDAVRIELAGPASSVERAMEAAHVALRSPRLEASTLRRWKQRRIESAERRKVQPGAALSELLAGALHPEEEARLHPLSSERVRAVDRVRAQAWLDRLVRSAPIEVAIVGEIGQKEAIDLAATYLGSLPARERISGKTLRAHRLPRFRQPPYTLSRRIDTPTAHAIVLVGAIGADDSHSSASLALDGASHVLSSRVNHEIRDEEGLAFSVGVRHDAGEGMPGTGLLSSWTYAPPEKAEDVADLIEEVFERCAEMGPTPVETASAKARMLSDLEERFASPRWWARTLSELTYRDRSVESLMNLPGRIEALDAEALHEALRQATRGDRRVRVIIGPTSSSARTSGQR